MILADLKTYMMENRIASVSELATHFDTDDNTVREMLAIWVRKGKIRQIQDPNIQCSKCARCHKLSTEIYEWVD